MWSIEESDFKFPLPGLRNGFLSCGPPYQIVGMGFGALDCNTRLLGLCTTTLSALPVCSPFEVGSKYSLQKKPVLLCAAAVIT